MRAFEIYRESGAPGFARKIFAYANWRFWQVYEKSLRLFLPEADLILYAGIPVGRRKIGDRFFTTFYDAPIACDIPTYEQGLVSALRTHVRKGDNITVVGVGSGVTCIIAAKLTETGEVHCFEGDATGIESLERVSLLNGTERQIHAHQEIVGAAISVYGDSHVASVTHPSQLPECDLLELDCEGAEACILSEMTIRPRVIAVETHGFLGAPSHKIEELLVGLGYEVTDLGFAEPRYLDACVKNDIRVLVGTRIY